VQGDDEPRRIARVMLAFQLARVGRLEASEVRFAQALAEAKTAGDPLHRCVAYTNRVALWTARQAPDRAIEDLQHAIQLAREIGNPEVERIAAHNVASQLHWGDRQAEALELARRARLLEERFVDHPVYPCSLLLAEILLAMDELEEPARLVQWMEQRCPPEPWDWPRWWALRRVLAELGAPGVTPPEQDWEAIVAESRRVSPLEGLLLRLYWRARMALRAERWDEVARSLQEAAQKRGGCPVWLSRFEVLERELARGPGNRESGGSAGAAEMGRQ
jgi:tetratricopeptide (TPR) repeat protein